MHKLVVLLCAVTLVFGMGEAAAAYSVSQQAQITSSGQVFNFNVGSVPEAVGAAVLTIEARGDYDSGSEQILQWSIDGSAITGGPINRYNADVYTQHGHMDAYMKKTYTLDAASMAAVTADNAFVLSMENSDAVNKKYTASQYVKFTLSYDLTIPEPSTLLMLGLGLIGVCGLGWKKVSKK